MLKHDLFGFLKHIHKLWFLTKFLSFKEINSQSVQLCNSPEKLKVKYLV